MCFYFTTSGQQGKSTPCHVRRCRSGAAQLDRALSTPAYHTVSNYDPVACKSMKCACENSILHYLCCISCWSAFYFSMFSKQQKEAHLNSISRTSPKVNMICSQAIRILINSNALETLFLTLLLSVNKVLVLTMNSQDFLAVGVNRNACMAGNASAFIYFTSVQQWFLSGN